MTAKIRIMNISEEAERLKGMDIQCGRNTYMYRTINAHPYYRMDVSSNVSTRYIATLCPKDKCFIHIADTIHKIIRLKDGKIRDYQIHNKPQMECLIEYLDMKDIQYSIVRSSDDSSIIVYNNYDKYKRSIGQDFVSGQPYSEPYRIYRYYIRVYKGFVNLCKPRIEEPDWDEDFPEKRFGIYLWDDLPIYM